MSSWNKWQEDTPGDSIRIREAKLLAWASLFVLVNRITLTVVRGEPWWTPWPILVWLVCAAATHIYFNQFLPKRDPYILPMVMLLTGWGLTLITRLAPAFALRQTMWLFISTIALISTTWIPRSLRILRRYRYLWLLAGISLLGLTLIIGVNPSGAPFAPRLWLGGRGVYFQPSEILKLLLLIFLASYLGEKREVIVTGKWHIGKLTLPPLPYLAPMLLMWGFCMILLIWQRDLGTASLFFLIFLTMLYIATGQIGYVLAGIVLLLLVAMIGYDLYSVVQLRVDTWINPWPEADNRAYQIVQSLLAVAAGGIIGEGVGLGAPTYIPVVHSDFAFAAIAEEWGLLGTTGVIMIIATIVMRSIKLATLNDSRPFHALLAAGIGITIGLQSLLIMGGVLKIIPLTGVTLPFVSYGGSSLLSSFIMVGILLRISDADTPSLLEVVQRMQAVAKERTI